MFAAAMNPKLAQFLDQAWDKGLDWLLANGLPLILTIGVTILALKAASFLIDKVGKAIQVGFPAGSGPRMAQRTTTLTYILGSTAKTVIVFAGGLMALSEIGINVTPILASAGIVGLAVGFGAQSLVKDVITGFFILLEDQYGVGDAVTIGDKSGTVEKMNLRITQLRTLEGALITIPNGSVAVVSNQSKEWARAVVDVGVSYEANLDHALAVMLDEGMKLRTEWPDSVIEAPEAHGVQSFADSSVMLRVVVKTAPLDQWKVAREWRRRIKAAFDREGLDIPFPQRVFRVKTEAEAKEVKETLGSHQPQ